MKLSNVLRRSSLGRYVLTHLISNLKSHTNPPSSIPRTYLSIFSTLYAQADQFALYESFCASHARAASVVRALRGAHPVEWEAYEGRCARAVRGAGPEDERMAREAESGEGRACGRFVGRKKRSLSTPSIVVPPFGVGSSAADGVVVSARDMERDREEREREKVEKEKTKRSLKRRSVGAYALGSSSFSTAPAPASPSPVPLSASAASSPVAPFASVNQGTNTSSTNYTRLKLLDYLIKPVQRICRYPLLLDQLKRESYVRSANGQDENTDMADLAGSTMRAVLERVNKASEREAHAMRAAIVAARLVHTGPPMSPISPSASSPTTSAFSEGSHDRYRHPHQYQRRHSHHHQQQYSHRPTGLTPTFVASLGPCMLAGALDVVHHPAGRAKYLATFVYGGGYVILAKVTKGGGERGGGGMGMGRAYEPRHWFSLRGFEVVEVDEDEGELFGDVLSLSMQYSQCSFLFE